MSIRRKHMKAERAFWPFRFLLPQLSSAWRSSCVEWTGDGGGSKWKIAVLSGYYLYICVCVCICSVMSDSATSWTAAHEAPVSMGFPRQEYWSGLPFPTSGELPHPGIEPESLASLELAGGFFTTAPPGKPIYIYTFFFCKFFYIYFLKFVYTFYKFKINLKYLWNPTPVF